MELEHAVGCNVSRTNIAVFHPNGEDIVYGMGGKVVVASLTDPHDQRLCHGHDNFVNCIAVANGGELIASGQDGPNADIIIFEPNPQPRNEEQAREMTVRFRFQEHDSAIQCLCFSHDDRLLVSCGVQADGRMFIWDTVTGLIRAWTHLAPNPTIHLSAGRFVKDIKRRETHLYQWATCGSSIVNLWHVDADTGEMTSNPVNAADKTKREWTMTQFSKDYEYLYCSSTTGDVAVVLLKNRVIQQFVCAINNISSIRTFVNLTKHAKEYLIVGGNSGCLTAFCGNECTEILDVDQVRLDSAIVSLDASPDQSEILCVTALGSMYRVKTANLAFTCPYQNPAGALKHVCFPSGFSDQFVTCGEDSNVTLWDLNDYSAKLICAERADNGAIPNCAAASQDIIVAGYNNARIKCFDMMEGEQLWRIDNAHKGGVASVNLSQNMRFIVTTGVEGEVRVWEVKGKEMISHLKEHTGRVNACHLFTNDQYAITGSRDRCILTWDLRAEKRLTLHREKHGGVNSIAVGNDQTTVFSAGQERTLTWWDLRQADAIKSVDVGEELNEVTLSNNNKFLATAGEGTTVKLYDTRKFFRPEMGRAEDALISVGEQSHSKSVRGVAWSADDRQVVSVSDDWSALIWNIYDMDEAPPA